MANLHQHISNLLEKDHLSKDLLELNLTATRAQLPGESAILRKIIGSFASVRTLLLSGCGLKDVRRVSAAHAPIK